MTHATHATPGVPRPATALHATTTYRADIDGLRAVAVLAVVVHHLAPELVPGGYVGVDVFFVISGFLITKIIAQEAAQGRFSFASFYARRARRILPALLAVLLATLAAGWLILLPTDFQGTLRAAAAAALSGSNLLFWRERANYFGALEERHSPLLHTWSLGVEEQFYLVFPLLLVAWLRLPRRRRMVLLAAAAGASLALASVLVGHFPNEVFYLLPFRAWELLAGAALAVGAVPAVGSPRANAALRLAGLGAITVSALAYSEATAFPGLSALLPVLGAAAVIHAGSGSAAPQSAGLLASRPMVYIGLISYSLYLWHWPVIVLAHYLELPMARAGHGLLLLALSLGLASLSYHLVERPLRVARPGRGRRQVAAAATLAGGVVGMLLAGIATQGYPGRFDPHVVTLDQARHVTRPYLHCFERPLEASCRLGADTAPDTVVWGDSHALVWAPSLETALRRAGRSALLVSTAGCAPVIDAGNRINPRCPQVNDAVRQMLQQPGMRTVVLAGFWSTYFREGGPIQHGIGLANEVQGAEGARRALQATVEWLQAQDLQVGLIGPVPVFTRNVPAALALEHHTGRTLLDRSRQLQDERHQLYRAAVEPLRARGVHTLEPMTWLCHGPQCRVESDGVPLYEDANHLSPAGAQFLLPRMSAAVARLLAPAAKDQAPPAD